jgi:16S rRNA (adenine1518-N6/adenine1519-N6)-dimethyltransferase
MLGATFAIELLFAVPPGAFRPAPKVDSPSRARAARRRQAGHPRPGALRAVVAAAFSQRRKTLRNAVSSLVTAEQFAAAGIDSQRRGETLSVGEFVALAAA